MLFKLTGFQVVAKKNEQENRGTKGQSKIGALARVMSSGRVCNVVKVY